jgi:hypothetical protein
MRLAVVAEDLLLANRVTFRVAVDERGVRADSVGFERSQWVEFQDGKTGILPFE